jgi:serine/threonine-protein kinase
MLVDGAGVCKLTDFGIAVRAGDRPVPAGMLAYAPPEQLGGGPASPAGDVYAATATFYECVVGRPPFTGDTPHVLMHRQMSEPVPMEPVPEPLRPLVAAGMATAPWDRPADAARFVTELRAAAGPAYGPDWEGRGRSHLGEATLLLAALWPSNSTPAAQDHAAEQVHLSSGSRRAHDPQHAGHLEYPRHSEGEHAAHTEHVEHLHHEHVEHLERVEQAETTTGSRSGIAAAAAVTGAAAVAAAANSQPPSSPPGTRAQHLIRTASRSKRVPRWMRNSLPHDPGPGAAIVIVAGAAAAVLIIVAVAAVLTATLTSSSSSPRAATAVPSPSTSTSVTAGTAPAVVTSINGSYKMTQHVRLCSPANQCILGPLSLRIVCVPGGSCTASSSRWGASHKLSFNGTTLSFTGNDSGVARTCNGHKRNARITMKLIAVSWKTGPGSVRTPKKLSGPYDVVAPPTAGCPAWHLKSTITS